MYGGLDISVSGMLAQRTRLDVIAANIANQDAILDADGNPSPYQRRVPVFMPGDPKSRTAVGRAMGVHVAKIDLDNTTEFRKVWDPSSPYAKQVPDKDAGHVLFPNVNGVVEQINTVEAMRAYEANVAAAEASKTMLAQALRLIA